MPKFRRCPCTPPQNLCNRLLERLAQSEGDDECEDRGGALAAVGMAAIGIPYGGVCGADMWGLSVSPSSGGRSLGNGASSSHGAASAKMVVESVYE